MDLISIERRRDDTRELRQLWLNPSSSILEQLSTPLLENPLGPKSDASTDLDKDLDLSASHIIDPGMEAKVHLTAVHFSAVKTWELKLLHIFKSVFCYTHIVSVKYSMNFYLEARAH